MRNTIMTVSTAGSKISIDNDNVDEYEGHDIVKISSKPFSSLPLFLPKYLDYDPETNMVSKISTIDNLTKKELQEGEDEESEQSNHHHLRLVPNAGLEMLQEWNKDDSDNTNKNTKQSKSSKQQKQISVIACVGPYRTGKSFLVSRFLKDSNAFEIGPTLEGCTRGIWISTSALRDKSTGVFKLILDCEGLGDPLVLEELQQATNNTGNFAKAGEGGEQDNEKTNEEEPEDAMSHDARIALTSLLLSNVFLFNTTSHPDRGSLQFLNYLDTIRKRIPNTTSQSQRNFPNFVWVFRDFFLQLPYRRKIATEANRNEEPPQQYTLKEYMLERVLQVSPSSSSQRGGAKRISPRGAAQWMDAVEGNVVDSLLTDFASLEILSVGYPQRQGGYQFTAEEMSTLGDIPWDDLDETFQAEVQSVLRHCLTMANTPFSLSSGETPNAWRSLGNWFAGRHGTATPATHNSGGIEVYTKWCETVVDLVNSQGIIPNLPDLQHQLLESMAEERVAQAVKSYEQELKDFLNQDCPVYNEGNNNTAGGDQSAFLSYLVETNNLQGVAESEELLAKSVFAMERLREELLESITSASILHTSLQQLQDQCCGDGHENDDGLDLPNTTHPSMASTATVLGRIQQENRERSLVACRVLAQQFYAPFQNSIRDPETTGNAVLSVEEFDSAFGNIQDWYYDHARGPTIDMVCQDHLVEPSVKDRQVFQTLQSQKGLLANALAQQTKLSEDVASKNEMVQQLQDNITQIQEQSTEAIETLQSQHAQKLEEVLAKQKEENQAKLRALEDELQSELRTQKEILELEQQARAKEIDLLQTQAETRLSAEIALRDERIKREHELHESELAKIKEVADERMAKEIASAEEQRKREREAIESEMTKKLQEAERKMQEELKQKQEELQKAKEILEAKEREKSALLERVEQAENDKCCIVM